MSKRVFVLAALLVTFLTSLAGADGVRVYLVTFGPGDEVWEQFGHNAIEIVDPAATDPKDRDVACNWGVFDFFQDAFYRRFVFGRMLYRMDVDKHVPEMIEAYRQANRSVYRQELNLTEKQKNALYDYVAWNSQDGNREYRYDYYRDNCSTRVRDVIDRSVLGDVKAQLEPKRTGVTYRWHTRRITAENVPLYTVLLFILGHPVDRPLSAWEESFLPLKLREHLRDVTVLDDQGKRVPIIKSEETIFEASRGKARGGPPHWFVPFLALGIGCAAVFAALTYLGRRSTVARVLFYLLASIWGLFVGFAGTFALWGWMCTEHVAVYRNENILHFFPPAILLIVLIPLASRGWKRCARVAWYIAAGTVVSSLLGVALKISPSFRQVDAELIAWVLPTHIAMAWGCWEAFGCRGKKWFQPIAGAQVVAG